MLGGFGILMLIPQLILLLIKTRFIIPMAYAAIVVFRFPEWNEAHKTLADTIFFILVGLVVVSWIITLVRAIKRRRDN